jgi:RNA polymerase sigma factor (sigma-70 family)
MSAQVAGFWRQVQRLFAPRETEGHSDRQLLERYAQAHDETAFAVLVERHGGMVLGVCHRLLSNREDAEDAFQATFLILARRAQQITWRESVAGWLHEVAWRVARKLRQKVQRHTVAPLPAWEPPSTEADPAEAAAQADLLQHWHAHFDEELRRLPEQHRTPLVLCCLEGQTHKQAAELLGWPVGTVKGRLARAREQLRERLQQRGLELPLALFGSVLAAEAAWSLPTLSLENLTLDLVRAIPADGWKLGPQTARCWQLAEGVERSMRLQPFKGIALIVGTCVSLLLLGLSASWAMQTSPPPQKPMANPAADAPRPEVLRHPSAVRHVAFSPDGKQIATATEDGIVRIWDAATGKEVRRLEGKRGSSGLAWLRDGRILAGSTIHLQGWDATTGKPLFTFDTQNLLHTLAFSPDGKYAAWGWVKWHGGIYDLEKQKLVVEKFPAPGEGTTASAFSHDSRWLALNGRNPDPDEIHLYDMQNPAKSQRHFTADQRNVKVLAFTPDDRLLVSAGDDHTVKFWPTSLRSRPLRDIRAQYRRIGAVAFAPNGKTVAVCSYDPTVKKPDATIQVFELSTGQERLKLQGHSGPINALAFSPQGDRLVSGSSDGTAMIWNLKGSPRP